MLFEKFFVNCYKITTPLSRATYQSHIIEVAANTSTQLWEAQIINCFSCLNVNIYGSTLCILYIYSMIIMVMEMFAFFTFMSVIILIDQINLFQ